MEQLLREFQKDPSSLVFISLAETYRKQGLLRQALEICNEGLLFHPGLASAMVLRAQCYFDQRKYANCLAELASIINENPENIKALKLRAQVHLHLGQDAAAQKVLEQILQIIPKDIDAHRFLEEIENKNFQQDVPVQNIVAVSSDTNFNNVQDFEIKSLVNIREIDESSGDDEEIAFATRTIAELYIRQGLKQKAKVTLRKILQENAADFWAQNKLAELEGKFLVDALGQDGRLMQLQKKAEILKKLLNQVRSKTNLSYTGTN